MTPVKTINKMSIQKIEKHINKISNLVQSIKEADEFNAIERDLLLSYTRSLYDKILSWEGDQGSAITTQSTISESKEMPRAEAPVIPPVETPEPPRKEMVDMAHVAREELRIEKENTQIQEKSVEENPVMPEVETPKTTPIPSLEKEEGIPEEMEEIFSNTVIADLSDRYGNAPITDLSKSMGINEKIFTIQELFGGDKELFQTTISRLNNFESFHEAKVYLANGVARDQHWNEGSNIKKATNFVKLVQRRYA